MLTYCLWAQCAYGQKQGGDYATVSIRALMKTMFVAVPSDPHVCTRAYPRTWWVSDMCEKLCVIQAPPGIVYTYMLLSPLYYISALKATRYQAFDKVYPSSSRAISPSCRSTTLDTCLGRGLCLLANCSFSVRKGCNLGIV